MPSTASRLLLRASRDIARAVREVASRRRALPTVAPSGSGSGSGGPAYPRSPLPSSFRRGGGAPPSALACCHPPTTKGQGSRRLGSPNESEAPPLSNSNLAPADISCSSPAAHSKVEFVVEDADLESEQGLFFLYMRWCITFNEPRAPDEMLCNFGIFKEMVLDLASRQKSGSPYRLILTPFTDGKRSRNGYIHHGVRPPSTGSRLAGQLVLCNPYGVGASAFKDHYPKGHEPGSPNQIP